jgi:hypothetical protein
VVALVMTLSLWAMWLNSTVSYALHPDGSGVDMGTIFLIFISPVVISIAAFGVEALRRSTAARP